MSNSVSLILGEIVKLDVRLANSLKDMNLSKKQQDNLKKFKDSIKMFVEKLKNSEKDLTTLINAESITMKKLDERFSGLIDLFDVTNKTDGSLAQIIKCMNLFNIQEEESQEQDFERTKKQDFERTKKQDFERTLKTLQMRLKISGSNRDMFLDIVDTLLADAKKYKGSSDDNIKLQGEILRYLANFLKCVSVQISSVLSDLKPEVLKPKLNLERSKKGNVDDLSPRTQRGFERWWPTYWKILKNEGTFGAKLDVSSISGLKIFNYTESGELKVDSTSYTQGCIKNCYFIAALKSLSHAPKGQECLRNCFDKMTDDDLQFKNEKSEDAKLKKEFMVGFYKINFDAMPVNTLQHLGTMAKGKGGRMEVVPDAQKIYFKVACKDLLASGMFNTKNELWPLVLEHAWGMYLIEISKQLEKRAKVLPCKFKTVTDPTREFPDVVAAEGGDYTLLSKFAENMYDSIALASITGKRVKIVPVDSNGETKYDQCFKKLSNALGSGKVVTAFNGHETEISGKPSVRTSDLTKEEFDKLRIKDVSGEPITHKIILKAEDDSIVVVYPNHAISVQDCRAQCNKYLLDCEDTMVDNGPKKGAFTVDLKQFVDNFDHINISSV